MIYMNILQEWVPIQVSATSFYVLLDVCVVLSLYDVSVWLFLLFFVLFLGFILFFLGGGGYNESHQKLNIL